MTPRRNTKNVMTTQQLDQIVARADQLALVMSHGHACYAACRELGVPEEDVPATASIVSAELLNRELNPRRTTPAEDAAIARTTAAWSARTARINSLVPKYLAEIAAELEAEAARRGGNWGWRAIAALRRGQPRSEHIWEARRRAAAEVDAR